MSIDDFCKTNLSPSLSLSLSLSQNVHKIENTCAHIESNHFRLFCQKKKKIMFGPLINEIMW